MYLGKCIIKTLLSGWNQQSIIKDRSVIKNKEGRQLNRLYVCLLHTVASAAVPKLVSYIQYEVWIA
jgi:hypothetical protein